MRLLVTGGAGFMGSNFVRYMAKKYSDIKILVYDKLTYAGRIENLKEVLDKNKVSLIRADICDQEKLEETVKNFQPDIIVNFAAETHVDRSINEPAPFIRTNVFGVYNILETLRRHDNIKLIHISTDEVYGDRWGRGPADEETAFKPSSPYSASKASGDLFCQAYWKTYRVPVIIVRPSNNYGPYQYPEKLIPRTIIRALHNRPIPIYGSGGQIRDWLYVEDFSRAIELLIHKGRIGEQYNLPGMNERKNIEVVKKILEIMNKPLSLIVHVEDRPGHDRMYSMKGDKIMKLGWRPVTPWEEGLRKTVKWYLENEWWWRPLLTDDYFEEDTPWRPRK